MEPVKDGGDDPAFLLDERQEEMLGSYFGVLPGRVIWAASLMALRAFSVNCSQRIPAASSEDKAKPDDNIKS